MELSIFLAKMLGLYFLLLAVVGLFRQKSVKNMLRDIGKEPLLIWTIASVEIAAGLALILGHSVWQGWELVITLVGWAFLIEGLFYLLFPARTISKVVRRMAKGKWYSLGILLSLIIGVYLAGYGFGFF